MINEKNDLMKNIGGNESNSLRKYLIIGGGVFILFVIGIVASKFLFSSPKKDNTSVILPPEIKQQKVEQKDTALFNDIPVENEFKKPQQNTTQTQQIQKPAIPAQNTQVNNKPVAKPEKKAEVETVEIKPQEKVKVNTKTQKPAIKRNYYIQVAAVTRGNPSKKFLKLIKKNGFDYKIEQVNVKGMNVKRVLIGGYTYKEVKQVLPKVRAKISSSAFIKRLK